VCQFNLWAEPGGAGASRADAPGVGLVACLGYSRAGAGADLQQEAPDVLWGMTRCLWSLGGLLTLLVWDREECVHVGAAARPTPMPPFAGS
jgi:hypothetical protein